MRMGTPVVDGVTRERGTVVWVNPHTVGVVYRSGLRVQPRAAVEAVAVPHTRTA